MQRTVKEVIATVLARRNWAPKAASTSTKLKDVMSNALSTLYLHVEGAMVEAQYRTMLYKTIESKTQGIEIHATADPLVMRITKTGGAALTAWTPAVDGSWDGSMWLEITTSRVIDGVTKTVYELRQSLDWWSVIGISSTSYYVSIDRPWPNSTDTALAFRIIQRYVWMPSEVLGLLNQHGIQLIDEIRQSTKFITTAAADTWNFENPTTNTLGQPNTVSLDDNYTEPAPSTAPALAVATEGLGSSVAWAGPVQEGDFEFYYTFCWGVMHSRWQQAKNGLTDCLFESHPSPISATWSHNTNPGVAIKITVTNPDQMRGFFDSTRLSYGHSGRFIRLYVKRKSVRTAGLGTYNNVDADNVPYLLAEFNATASASSYVWTGSVIPEYTRRIKFTSGYYQALAVAPYADQLYELVARMRYYPPDLLSDADIIPVHPLAMSVFLELCEAEAARLDGADLKSYNLLKSEALRQATALRAALSGPVVVSPSPYGMTNRNRPEFTMQRLPPNFFDGV